jgi:predicted transcriptional regulator of viral defense system
MLQNPSFKGVMLHIIVYKVGFGTAAAHYGLTTQHRNVIFIVTPERPRARAVSEAPVQIVNHAESKFFGFEPVDVLGYQVMISDREKTAIDCVDHPALAGGVGETAAILATASRRLDWTKAADYLERIGAGALARRFGWLADHVTADIPPAVRERLLALAARSRKTWLGPAPEHVVPGAIGYDPTWRVFVNVSRQELHGSAGLGRRKTLGKDS